MKWLVVGELFFTAMVPEPSVASFRSPLFARTRPATKLTLVVPVLTPLPGKIEMEPAPFGTTVWLTEMAAADVGMPQALVTVNSR